MSKQLTWTPQFKCAGEQIRKPIAQRQIARRLGYWFAGEVTYYLWKLNDGKIALCDDWVTNPYVEIITPTDADTLNLCRDYDTRVELDNDGKRVFIPVKRD